MATVKQPNFSQALKSNRWIKPPMSVVPYFLLTLLLSFSSSGQVCSVKPVSQSHNLAASIRQTEQYLKCLQRETKTPGLALAIVYKDQVKVLQGYGVRKAGSTQKVNEDTVFEIASVSKPVSSTVIASLVGEGKVSWDDRVATLDPQFQLSDPTVTAELTIRDLFSHRSGLPDHAGDELEELGYTRPDTLQRLRSVPLTGTFRDTYAYTNLGLTEGAVAVARKMGRRWEDLADQQLFSRLGMTHSSFRFSDYQNARNKAALHVFENGNPVSRYVREADAEAPAGGVSASVRDLAQWLRLQMAGGTWNGQQIIASQALDETHQPIICTGKSQNGVCGAGGYYGLGWVVSIDGNGRKTLGHSGAFLLGASTTVRFVPDENIGIIVLSNTMPLGVPEAIALTFLDLFQYGQLRVPDWFATVNPTFQDLINKGENKSPNYSKKTPPESPAASAPLSTYVGHYISPYYGSVEIVQEHNSLAMLLPPLGKHYDLQHWDGDTFTYYIAGESSGVGRRGVVFDPGRSLLLENYVATDEVSGKVYENGVFVKTNR
jgi:CubicO group peptidase (beta-lactamase class C family)